MEPNDYKVEEYKHIGTAIIEVEKHILQIFGGAVAVAVPLLSAIAKFILDKEGGQIPIALVYAALAPNILVIPAFYLLLSQRISLARLGSYRRVFFEEQNGIRGWETRLGRFRGLQRTESNDPIPYTFWAVFCASAALFIYGIYSSSASGYHLLILGIPVIFIMWCHYKWKYVFTKNLCEYLKLWNQDNHISSERAESMSDGKSDSEAIPVQLIDKRRWWDKNTPLFAFVTSIAALGLSIYFADRTHQHNELSVAPLVTIWHEPDQPKSEQLKPEQLKPVQHWKITNAGLGPAKIADIAIFVNRQRGKDSIADTSHWEKLASLTEVKLTVNWGKLLVPGEGFRAGDEIQPFSLSWNNIEEMEKTDIDTLAVLAICYCSFYKKCEYADSRVYSESPKEPYIKDCSKKQ